MTRRLRRDDILGLLRQAAKITAQDTLVIVGSGAAILGLKIVPLGLAYTTDVDIYAPDAKDVQDASDVIDFVLGEGSDFHVEHGYYAHGVDQNTSYMPSDWVTRAERVSLGRQGDTACLCPEINDIALAKVCAWREKDRGWLKTAYESGILDQTALIQRIGMITHPSAPSATDVEIRIRRVLTSPQIMPESGGPR